MLIFRAGTIDLLSIALGRFGLALEANTDERFGRADEDEQSIPDAFSRASLLLG